MDLLHTVLYMYCTVVLPDERNCRTLAHSRTGDNTQGRSQDSQQYFMTSPQARTAAHVQAAYMTDRQDAYNSVHGPQCCGATTFLSGSGSVMYRSRYRLRAS